MDNTPKPHRPLPGSSRIAAAPLDSPHKRRIPTTQTYPELLAIAGLHAHVPVSESEKELLGYIHGVYIEYGAVMYQQGRKDAVADAFRHGFDEAKELAAQAICVRCKQKVPVKPHKIYGFIHEGDLPRCDAAAIRTLKEKPPTLF